MILMNKKVILSLERVDAEQCLIKIKTVLTFPGRSLCKQTSPVPTFRLTPQMLKKSVVNFLGPASFLMLKDTESYDLIMN